MSMSGLLFPVLGWLRWWVGDWGVWLLAAMLAACVLELRPRRPRWRR